MITTALGASSPPQMNAINYLIANAAPGHETIPRGFTSDFFEVYSPPIRSRYAGVVWRVLEPVPLPASIVSLYNGTAMAVTGFEVDVIRKVADGEDTSVPNFQSYNHHFTAHLHGAGARLSANAVGTPNIRHRVPFERTDLAPSSVPHLQAFNEHNGNEARQTYHGLPSGFVQPLFSPVSFVFNPMQINLLNPDGSGTRGGPLPRSSAAPKDAKYSGLLECPCTTRIHKDLNKSTINGRYFNPHCTADKERSDLLANHNPTCSVATYVGGMECCKDEMVLLDADQLQPEHIDEIYFKWRFYHEAFNVKKHTPIIHLEWAVNGCDSGGPRGNPSNCPHIEYDVVKAIPGTPPSKTVHTVTSHFQVRDMLAKDCDPIMDEYCASEKVAMERGGKLRLIMAGGHCHSPACISLELWNRDTAELICRITPVLGKGDKVFDEAGYLFLPPCQWGEEEGLLSPPVLDLDANLTAIKRANNTEYHYGVMGIWQMRGAYV